MGNVFIWAAMYRAGTVADGPCDLCQHFLLQAGCLQSPSSKIKKNQGTNIILQENNMMMGRHCLYRIVTVYHCGLQNSTSLYLLIHCYRDYGNLTWSSNEILAHLEIVTVVAQGASQIKPPFYCNCLFMGFITLRNGLHDM